MTGRHGVAIAVILGLAVWAAVPAVSEAGFILGGNSNIKDLTPGATFDTTADYAVFQQEVRPVVPEDPYGIGFANSTDATAFYTAAFNRGTIIGGPSTTGLDTSAEYLYLYMLANNGSGSNTNNTMTLELEPGAASTIVDLGYFTGYVFQDAEGEVNANPPGTQNDFGDDTQVFSDPGAPSLIYSAPVTPVVTTASAIDPKEVRLNLLPFPSFRVTMPDSPATELQQTHRSSVFGFTSSIPPSLPIASFQDSSENATGVIPAPVPEPSVLIMGIGCVLAGAVIGLRRRRKS